MEIVEGRSTSEVLASILLLDQDGVHLRHGAAPHLPESYTRPLTGSRSDARSVLAGLPPSAMRRSLSRTSAKTRYGPISAIWHWVTDCAHWVDPFRANTGLGTFACIAATAAAGRPDMEQARGASERDPAYP